MLKRFKQALSTLIVSAALLFPVAVPVMVHAQTPANINNSLCGGVNLKLSTPSTDCTDSTAETTAQNLVTKIINLFSALVGIVAVIMIVVGGFKYITSGGNDGNVSTAKNTILYAVIGLIIVGLAQVIVKYVLTTAKA